MTLDPTIYRKTLLINAAAGDNAEQVKQLKLAFNELFEGGEIIELKEAHFNNGLDFLGDDPEVIYFVAGGDGTLAFVANQFRSRFEGAQMPVLAPLPFGSANGLTRDLGIVASPVDALKGFAENACLLPADIVQIITGESNLHCFHLADVGLNADIVQHAEQYEFRGMKAYFLGLVQAIGQCEPFGFKIKEGDKTLEGEAVMLLVGNARVFGTGANINPTGMLNDGAFEIVVVKDFQNWELIGRAIDLFSASKQVPEWMEIHRFASAELVLEDAKPWQVDGQVCAPSKHFELSVLPQKITYLVTEACPYL